MSRTRVAVTGAAGAIGRSVVDLLADGGRAVTAIVRDLKRAPAHGKVVPVVADYADPAALDLAISGADSLVLIGSDGRADRVLAHHHNILAAARGAGVRRIVLLSSQDADSASPFCYAPVYADTERELGDSCEEPVVLRAGLYAEFFGRWVLEAAASGELALPTAAAVAPISRADVARALVAAVLDPVAGTSATITGPEALDPDALAALASGLGARAVRARTITSEEFRHHLIAVGTDPWWSFAFTSLFEAIEQGRFARVTNDFTALTGRRPETVEDALRRQHPAG